MNDYDVNKNEKDEEDKLYLIIEKSLSLLCKEKPSDPIYYLSSKMLEEVGVDIKTLDLKIYSKVNNKEKLMLTTVDKLSDGKSFHETYKIVKNLGKGNLGSVFLIEKRVDANFKYCAKIIEKQKNTASLLSETQKNKLQSLDSKCIVKIVEIEEDENNLYFINEYCPNGNLLEYISNNKNSITEEVIIDICKQLFNALFYLHHNNIVHKEVKLENIMVYNIQDQNSINNNDESVSESNNNQSNIKEKFIHIKLADFGSSSLNMKNNKSSVKDYSPEALNLISPEAITDKYCMQSDLYSAGIIMYFLFSGKYPWDSTLPRSEILYNILNKEIDFSPIKNQNVVEILKDLLSKEIEIRTFDPEIPDQEFFNFYRIWASDSDQSKDEKDKLQFMEVFNNVGNFVVGKNLRQIVLNYMVNNKLYKEKSFEMARLFDEADTNKDGSLDVDELLKKYSQFFPGTTDEQKQRMKQLVSNLDINKNGKIDYGEFMLISSQLNKEASEKVMKEVFDYFDENKNGFIEINDLTKMMKSENLEYERFQEMINEFDQNSDGSICFEEFLQLINRYN